MHPGAAAVGRTRAPTRRTESLGPAAPCLEVGCPEASAHALVVQDMHLQAKVLFQVLNQQDLLAGTGAYTQPLVAAHGKTASCMPCRGSAAVVLRGGTSAGPPPPTRKGSLMPSVFVGSAGQVMYVDAMLVDASSNTGDCTSSSVTLLMRPPSSAAGAGQGGRGDRLAGCRSMRRDPPSAASSPHRGCPTAAGAWSRCCTEVTGSRTGSCF